MVNSKIEIQDPTNRMDLYGGFFQRLVQKPASIFKSKKGLKSIHAPTPRMKPTTIPITNASNAATVTESSNTKTNEFMMYNTVSKCETLPPAKDLKIIEPSRMIKSNRNEFGPLQTQPVYTGAPHLIN